MTPETETETLIAIGLVPIIEPYTHQLFLQRAKAGDLTAVQAYLTLGMPVDVRDETSQATALLRAAEGNHPAVLRVLAEAGADLEARDKDDDTALLTAVNWKHPEALQTLIELGADVNVYSRKHDTPLICAIANGRHDMLEMLLKAGADINQIAGEEGCSALNYAVMDNKPAFVKALLAARADTDSRFGEYQRPPLLIAVRKKLSDMVPLFIEAGAYLEAKDTIGWTAWRTAYHRDVTAVADMLAAAGADTTLTPDDDLLRAALTGNVDELCAALEAGANIDAPDSDGESALGLACWKGHAEAVAFLLEAGAQTEAILPGRQTPLMYALGSKCTACVTTLLQSGAKPTHGKTWSPLIKAVQNNDQSLVQQLIAAGVALEAHDAYRQTPFFWAVGKGYMQMVDLLIDAGPNINCQSNKGTTPLNFAVKENKTEMVDRLIKAGADLDLANNMGETPLHQACFNGATSLALTLLEAGADPTLRDPQGKYPLAQAVMMNKRSCIAAVREYLTERPFQETLQALNLTEGDELPESFFAQLAATQTDVSLVEWATLGRTAVVAGLLRAGFSTEARNGYAETLLIIAANEQHEELVRILLEMGADTTDVSNTGSTALHKAAYKGNLPIINLLLDAGIDPNHMDKWRQTPVHSAVDGGQIEALVRLYEAGGLIEPDPAGDVPLIRAARFNQTTALKWLIDNGAKLDIRNRDLETPLMLAVKKRNYRNVWYLLEAGANPDIADNRTRTPLMHTAMAGEMEILQLLLKHDASTTQTDSSGQTALELAAHRPQVVAFLSKVTGVAVPTLTLRPLNLPPKPPLHFAAHRGDATAVAQLIAAGVDVDERNHRGDTALMLAAERGHTAIVKALLDAGADIQAENKVGETAWVRAATFKREETEAVLLEAGAVVDTNKLVGHFTRLEQLRDALRDGEIKEIHALVEKGTVDIDGLSANRQPALITAVSNGDEPLTRLLLSAGADPDIPNLGGYTPLMVAARVGQLALVNLLIEAKVRINLANPQGGTALFLAAGTGQATVVTTLLDAGADPNLTDQRNISPLMQAVAAGSGETVKILLERGADTRIFDIDGRGVADWARAYGQTHLAKLWQGDNLLTHWHEIHRLRPLYMIQTAVATPEMWVLRGMDSIYGYDPETHQIAWEITDINKGVMNVNHEMAYVGGVVATSVFFGREEKRGWLFGFDPESGTAVWQQRTGWQHANDARISGVKTTPDHIIIVDTREGEPAPTIVWLDPVDGTMVYETAGVRTNFTGVMTEQAIYYHTGWRGSDKGLYRVATQPGDTLTKVADIGCQSLIAHDGIVYAYIFRENGEVVKKLLWWRASDGEQLGEMVMPAAQAEIYRKSHLVPTSQPYRIFLADETQCCLIDLQTQEVVWEREFPKRISYPSLTANGIFLSYYDEKRNQPYLLDEADGTPREAPFTKCQRVFPMDTYMLGGESFATRIYASTPIEAPAELEEWPKFPADTVVVETDVPIDPRDELQRMILEAGASGTLDAVYKQLRQLFTIRSVPDMVKDYLTALRAGEIGKKPLDFTLWDRLYAHCLTYHSLFKFGPKNRYFPAFLIASEEFGVEFWLMVGTGDVIALHHDATFFEVAYDVWQTCGGNVNTFNKRFVAAGSRFKIDQLLRFQQEFAGQRTMDFDDIPAEELYRRWATAFGWSLAQLEENLNHSTLEFLYTTYRDRDDELIQMIMEEEDGG